MANVTVPLRPDERRAAQRSAFHDRRDLAAQLAYLACCELKRRGYLAEESQQAEQTTGHSESTSVRL